MNNLMICPFATLENLDERRALNIREIRLQFGMRTQSGDRVSLAVLRRWGNPKRGYQPIGKDGPTVLLPLLKARAELLAMPEWVQWFLETCKRIKHERGLREAKILEVG